MSRAANAVGHLPLEAARYFVPSLVIVIVVTLTAALLAGLEGTRSRLALDAARRENETLQQRHSCRGDRVAGLAHRVEIAVAQRRHVNRLTQAPDRVWPADATSLPPAGGGDAALQAWLATQASLLQSPATVGVTELGTAQAIAIDWRPASVTQAGP